MTENPAGDPLLNFNPEHANFIGVDSDGCVFDTMEIKQRNCFHGEIVRQWKLEPIEKYVRETAEFVNLYSIWRGSNRFSALLRTFELLAERDEVDNAGAELPDTTALREYVESGLPLSNETLKRQAEKTGDKELLKIFEWSSAVNRNVEIEIKSPLLFRWTRESLEKIHSSSDMIVVSQTPTETLAREWEENGIAQYVHLIAGQEMGTKTEQLEKAIEGRYDNGRVMMIGDAPGDLTAARAVNASFYPINPGYEEDSWERFYYEAFDRFLNGKFEGSYSEGLLAEFEALLPATPPWVK